MEIVEEIKRLSTEIERLQKEIAENGKSIEKLASKEGEIAKAFEQYSKADAAAMSVRELNKANKELESGYSDLEREQEGYEKQITSLEKVLDKQREELNLIAQAQRDALLAGDMRGASRMLESYKELNQQMTTTSKALNEARDRYDEVGVAMENNADVVSRYNDVLEARKEVENAKSIEELTELYNKEGRVQIENARELQEYYQKISVLKEKLADPNIDPKQKEIDTAALEKYKKLVEDTTKAQEVALERQNIFAKALGKNEKNTAFGSTDKSGDNGEGAAAAFEKVANSAASASKVFGQLRTNLTSIRTGFSGLAKGGASAAAGLSAISKGVSGLISMVGKLNKSLLALLTNPIVLTIAAIVASLKLLYDMVSSFSKTAMGGDMFAKWKGYIEGAKAFIERFVTEVQAKVSEFVRNFASIFTKSGAVVKEFVISIGNAISAGLEWVVAKVKNGWRQTKAWFTGEELTEDDLVKEPDFDNLFSGVKKAAGELSDIWKKSFTKWELPSLKTFMNEYARIEELQRSLIKQQRAFTVASAESERAQAEQLQRMKELQDLINNKYSMELSMAQKELDIQRTKNSLKGKGVTDDELKAEADLAAKVLGIETKRQNEMRSLTNRHTDLVRALNEQKREQERIMKNYAIDATISKLQEQLKYEKDITKQLELQKQINDEQQKKSNQNIDKQKADAITQMFGNDAGELVRQGKSKEEIKAQLFSPSEKSTEDEVKQLQEKSDKFDEVWGHWEEVREAEAAKANDKVMSDALYKDYQAYLDYSEKVVEAAEWRTQELKKLDMGESQLTQDQIDRIFNEKINQAGKNANIDVLEERTAQLIADFVGQLADATADQIQEAQKEFEKNIEGENAKINGILGMSGEEKEARQEELDYDEQQVNQELEEGLITQTEAEERLLEIERERYLLSLDQVNLQSQLRKNIEAVEKVQRISVNKQQSASKVSQANYKKVSKGCQVAAQALGVVKDAADAVASTFGGSLSKKSKKALSAISDIANVGMTAIKGVETVVNAVEQGIFATTKSGVTAMQALESASVIIGIISAAVQIITEIVKVLMQFTKAAKMQDAIDEQKEKVEALEHEHEKLERAYQNSSGTDYYRGLAKSAEDYNKLLEENNKALQTAQELYEYQVSKYGNESDKAKDALEQVHELEDAQADFEDAQREQWQQLMEELSGSDLQSFSQNLASALVDGFKQGRDEINDVWEKTMDDLMRTMMQNQLALAIEDMFEPVFDKLNNATKNGDLVQSEIDEIMAEFDAKSEQAKYLAEQYYDLMNERGLLEDEDTQGSQGFGQMTQDQADTLTARFTALQMEGANVVAAAQAMAVAVQEIGADNKLQVASLQSLVLNSGLCMQIAQEQLDQMKIIADNTAMLSETNMRLKSIEQNTERL